MRIISGKLKGRRLAAFQASHIRPTTDREKETIFNKLMGHFEEARVLDLYSGTGSLGLEAHSRGAAHVLCIEKHPKSVKIIRQNLEQLKISDGVEVRCMDVFRFLKGPATEEYDVIFADPPFTQSLAHGTMEALAQCSGLAHPGTVVVIESSANEVIEDDYGDFKLLDRKDFGDKRVSFFKKDEYQ